MSKRRPTNKKNEKRSTDKKNTLTGLKANLDSNYAESVGDAGSCVDCASVTSFTSLPNEIGDWDDYNLNGSSEGLSLDDLETKMIAYLDRTTEKNAKTRTDALKKMRVILANKVMTSFIQARRDTVADAIRRCLRKGKNEEQENAVLLASILFITLGSSIDSDVVFEELYPLLSAALNDKSVGSKCREQCALALAVGCFIAPVGIDYIKQIMEQLFAIFSGSFPNGEGVYPTTLPPNITNLHNLALNAWSLLITLLPANKVLTIAELNLRKIVDLLKSTDQELRLSAGECISLLHEISRECDPEFEMKSIDELRNQLKELATYSQKFRSKKDRKVERSNFRDIMRTVLDYESPSFTVKRKDEIIELNCWTKKIQYDVFCMVLESGCQIHLGENQLIRDVLDLGPVQIDNSTSNRKYKKMECLAADKARSKFLRELQGHKYEIENYDDGM